MRLLIQTSIFLLQVASLHSFASPRQTQHLRGVRSSISTTRTTGPASSTTTQLYDTVNQSKDALRVMVDFHEGTWKGKATSFSVSSDVSAGIRLRKVSPEYKSTVKVGLDLTKQDYTLSETLEWSDKMKQRQLSLIDSSADVDTVDGSYSLDTSLPDFPSDLTGTNKMLQFGIEHCIAVNDNCRIRAFAFYALEDQSLARMVVCTEERVVSAEAEPSDSLLDASPSSGGKKEGSAARPELVKANEKLALFPMNLLELTSGVWLGDMVLREPASYQEPKGFSKQSKRSPSIKKKFASWSLGVQKLAHEWKWNFEDSIQKIITVGKPLGIGLPVEMSMPISGIVAENESPLTAIPKDQRMVYMDWMGGEQVGIIINNVALQFPRYLEFEQAGGQNRRPFFTEVTVFQAEENGVVDVTDSTASAGKLDLICSVSARAYSADGQLKQASSGFFELKRTSVEE